MATHHSGRNATLRGADNDSPAYSEEMVGMASLTDGIARSSTSYCVNHKTLI
jgi:hypothetical protein